MTRWTACGFRWKTAPSRRNSPLFLPRFWIVYHMLEMQYRWALCLPWKAAILAVRQRRNHCQYFIIKVAQTFRLEDTSRGGRGWEHEMCRTKPKLSGCRERMNYVCMRLNGGGKEEVSRQDKKKAFVQRNIFLFYRKRQKYREKDCQSILYI